MVAFKYQENEGQDTNNLMSNLFCCDVMDSVMKWKSENECDWQAPVICASAKKKVWVCALNLYPMHLIMHIFKDNLLKVFIGYLLILKHCKKF